MGIFVLCFCFFHYDEATDEKNPMAFATAVRTKNLESANKAGRRAVRIWLKSNPAWQFEALQIREIAHEWIERMEQGARSEEQIRKNPEGRRRLKKISDS